MGSINTHCYQLERAPWLPGPELKNGVTASGNLWALSICPLVRDDEFSQITYTSAMD